MKVFITGSKGQLGYELLRTVPDAITIESHDRDSFDITDQQIVNERLTQFQPDIIINCAAYTAVDKAEDEQELANAINHIGVQYLVEYCQNAIVSGKKTRLIQISTDFVYGGEIIDVFAIDQPPKPESVYAKTKLLGDQFALKHLKENALVIRTSWLYSAHGNNFVKTMLNLMNDRDSLGIVSNQIGTPTWAQGLAQAIWISIEKQLSGVHHWSDAGVASWYDFAQAIYEEGKILGLIAKDKQTKIKPIMSLDYPTPAKRPAFSVMDKSITWNALNYQAEHWRVALRKMLEELK